MKLREITITIIILLLPIIASIVAFCHGYSNFLETLLSTILGEAFVVALAYWLFRQPILDIRKLVEEYRKLQDKREYLRSVNDSVFKKWKNVSIETDNFHLEIKIKEEIDSNLLNQGKEFLKSRNDETRKILETWNQLNSSKNKYNEIGKRVRNKIEEHLPKAYRSLESRFSLTRDCYVTKNIIGFIEYSLKPIFLEDGKVDWEKILHVEHHEDTRKPPFRLVDNEGYDVIQSKNENDVEIKYFGKVMSELKPKIMDDLKRLDKHGRDVTEKTKEFQEKMNRLSNLIDLSLISD